jgi:hypothetical protein
MQYMSINSMQTMHYVPEIDVKLVGYAVSWILAIAMSTFGVVACT